MNKIGCAHKIGTSPVGSVYHQNIDRVVILPDVRLAAGNESTINFMSFLKFKNYFYESFPKSMRNVFQTFPQNNVGWLVA